MAARLYQKDACCSYCGHPFDPGQEWPRLCANCGNVTYRNPLPVSVVLLPVGSGLLTVRRNIAPGEGKLALPGGFIEAPETWQEAGARELLEETGIAVDPLALEPFDVVSTPDDTLIVFGLAPPVDDDLPPFRPGAESSQRVIIREPVEMAFPLHAQVVADYFNRRRNS